MNDQQPAGPRRPSRGRRLAGLAGPPVTGITAEDEPPAYSPAPTTAPPGAPAPTAATERAPDRATARPPARSRTRTRARGIAPPSEPPTEPAGATALAPATVRPVGWAYGDRHRAELDTRNYAAALQKAREKGAMLAAGYDRALQDEGATPADLARLLAAVGLGAGDVPPAVARAAGLA